jgi:hypothetical protein
MAAIATIVSSVVSIALSIRARRALRPESLSSKVIRVGLGLAAILLMLSIAVAFMSSLVNNMGGF